MTLKIRMPSAAQRLANATSSSKSGLAIETLSGTRVRQTPPNSCVTGTFKRLPTMSSSAASIAALPSVWPTSALSALAIRVATWNGSAPISSGRR